MLHAATCQLSNAAAANLICACLIALGYKNKDNAMIETTCIKELNKFLCPENAIKVYSKKDRKHT